MLKEYLDTFRNTLAQKSLHPASRPMTDEEIQRVWRLFGSSVDYGRVTITRDSIVTVAAPNALHNTVNLMSDWGHFVGDTLDLSEQGFYAMVHELTHVWQYQNGGDAYIADSLLNQAKAAISSGDRVGAYDWNAAVEAGIPWEKWGAEQQAQAASDFFLSQDRVDADNCQPDVMENARRTVAVLAECMALLRQGIGAPTFR